MTSPLFTPITLRSLTLPNRVVISPMCQYSAEDGKANDWHLQHYGHLSVSGAGLMMLEATAVTPEGRITRGCLGLYADDNERSLARVIAACRRFGNTRIGIQLAHAGRKGSAHRPWEGGRALGAQEGAWETVAPSAIAYGEHWPVPRAMGRDDLERIKQAFVTAVERAARLSLDVVELHAAHGYLLHEFLSPLANRRDDEYGGSAKNRMRYPLEIARAMRAAWPADRPMGVRISGSDWVEGGLTVEDAVAFARALRELGCDYVCVSSGGLAPQARIPVGPGYQVAFAARIKAEVGIATRTVGMIVRPKQAEEIIASGQADMVALGRALLDNPRWVWHAAQALGAEVTYPPQYERSRAALWPGARLARPEEG